jgi:hypothetical protein
LIHTRSVMIGTAPIGKVRQNRGATLHKLADID